MANKYLSELVSLRALGILAKAFCVLDLGERGVVFFLKNEEAEIGSLIGVAEKQRLLLPLRPRVDNLIHSTSIQVLVPNTFTS